MNTLTPDEWQKKILEIILRHGREAISIVDPDGHFIFLNESAARIMRGKPEDFIGKTIAEILPPQLSAQRLEAARRVLDTL